MNAHETASYALKKLSQTGAQQYSCEAHTAEKREFNVDGGLFSLLRTTIDNRLDLTLIKDHRRGKVLINSFINYWIPTYRTPVLLTLAGLVLLVVGLRIRRRKR